MASDRVTNPLVSIISGYYNREDYVNDSVLSLIDQSYSNIEIIIFDDNSSDNTYEKLKHFEYDQRVRIIKHPVNIGLTKGLIQAIDMANGEYIAIHGSGDISYRNRIEEQVSFLQDHHDYGVVGCYVENYHNLRNVHHLVKPRVIFHRNYRYAKAGYTHGEIMMRKNAYLEAGGYRSVFELGQMSDLIYRISLRYKLGVVQNTLYRRLSIEGGVSSSLSKTILQKYFLLLGKHLIVQRIKYGNDIIDLYGKNYYMAYNNFYAFQKHVFLLLLTIDTIEESDMTLIKNIFRNYSIYSILGLWYLEYKKLRAPIRSTRYILKVKDKLINKLVFKRLNAA